MGGGDPALTLAAALTWRTVLRGEAGKLTWRLNHSQLPAHPHPAPKSGFLSDLSDLQVPANLLAQCLSLG